MALVLVKVTLLPGTLDKLDGITPRALCSLNHTLLLVYKQICRVHKKGEHQQSMLHRHHFSRRKSRKAAAKDEKIGSFVLWTNLMESHRPQPYSTSGVQKVHHMKQGESQQPMMQKQHIFRRKCSLATAKDEKRAALYFENHTGLMFIFHHPYSSSDVP